MQQVMGKMFTKGTAVPVTIKWQLPHFEKISSWLPVRSLEQKGKEKFV